MVAGEERLDINIFGDEDGGGLGQADDGGGVCLRGAVAELAEA